MIIERQNILDLIGKNRSKYSSCIITCFSFDFTFFEERVIPALRTADIKNINVLLDGKYLEQSLERISGEEFRSHRTYSLNPIYEVGVFHPKIMLLAGPNQGLLIIGSGNLTSSGLSTNDEVWGAFHINSLESASAPLFAAVWDYLQQYFSQVKGFNKEKIRWIYQFSPWINELKNFLLDTFIRINEELEIRFLANNPNGSIYQELSKWLPKSSIKKLSMASPFFDDQGILLEQLFEDYKIEEMVCITDTQFGLLPSQLRKELHEKIRFYDWKDCLKNFDLRINRLHAKIFQFEYQDGWEYLLIGSPNATSHAFGTKYAKAKNGEAALLLRRKLKNGYFHDLGINTLKAEPLNVYLYKRENANRGDSIGLQSGKWENRIINSERNGSRLTIHLQKEAAHSYQIQVLDFYEVELERHAIEQEKIEYMVELQRPEQAYRTCLYWKESRITNYSLIHNIASQAKCNPDPSRAELSQIMDNLIANPENDHYIELLRYADYNWIDELEDPANKTGRGVSKSIAEQDVQRIYESLTEEKFYQLNAVHAEETEILSNPSAQIAEILNIISRGLLASDQKIGENVEEALSFEDVEDQQGTGDEVPQTLKVKVRGQEEQKALKRHITKVSEFYRKELDGFFKNKTLRDTPARSLKMKDLTNMSALIDLLYIFYGESYSFSKTEFGLLTDKKYGTEIGEIEKKYKLNRLKRTDPENLNAVFYEVDSNLFPSVKSKLLAVTKSLLLPQEEYSTLEYKKSYLQEGVLAPKAPFGVKPALVNTLGSFLICANANAGFHDYHPYLVVNDKINHFRREIFEKATFLVLNIRWKQNEQVYRDLILLDLLHFIFPQDLDKKEINELAESLQVLYDKASRKGEQFFESFNFYLAQLLPRYIQWKRDYTQDRRKLLKEVSNIHHGTMVFNSGVGFAVLRQVGREFILLKKPGLPWNEEMEEPVLKIKYIQLQITTF